MQSANQAPMSPMPSVLVIAPDTPEFQGYLERLDENWTSISEAIYRGMGENRLAGAHDERWQYVSLAPRTAHMPSKTALTFSILCFDRSFDVLSEKAQATCRHMVSIKMLRSHRIRVLLDGRPSRRPPPKDADMVKNPEQVFINRYRVEAEWNPNTEQVTLLTSAEEFGSHMSELSQKVTMRETQPGGGKLMKF